MSNNAVRIEPLNAHNYDTWKLQMKAILIKADLWNYVETEKAPATENEAKWISKDQKACAEIMLSIAPSELGLISKCATSNEMWNKLKSTFQSKGPARKATLLKRVALARMKEGDNTRDHLNDFFEAVGQLKEINVEIGDDLLAILLLYSLPDSFETFRCALETRDELPSPEILRVKILEEDESRKVKSERDSQTALYAGGNVNKNYNKNSREQRESKWNNKRKNNKKQSQGCFKCGKHGHFAVNCRSKQYSNYHKETDVNTEKSLFNCSDAAFSCADVTNSWCLDSGCTSHMSSNLEEFENIEEIKKTLCLANGQTSEISGVGDVKLNVIDNKHENKFKVKNVMYVKDLRTNLMSISKLADKGYEICFKKSEALIIENNKIICRANRIGNLYFLKNSTDVANVAEDKEMNNLDMWHRRLGHLNENDLRALATSQKVHGFDVKSGTKLSPCTICLSEKQTKTGFEKNKGIYANNILEIVHSDVCGPMPVASHSKYRYFVTFIDDFSRYCEVHFLKHKSDVFDAFKTFKNSAENFTGMKIKFLQTDNGREYLNGPFNQFLMEAGIKRRLTAPHTPQQNGIAERKNRTLLEMARCLLKQGGVPKIFWAEAINMACYIRNRCPTSSLAGDLPLTLWTGKKPSLKHMRPFGIKGYVLIKDKSNGKLDSRSEEGILVGYADKAKAYRIWSEKRRKVIISRDVRFINENVYDRLITPSNEEDSELEEETEDEESVEKTQKESDILETKEKENLENVPKETPKAGKGRPRIVRTGARGRPKKMNAQSNLLNKKDENEKDLDEYENENENEEEFEDCEYANVALTGDPLTFKEAMSCDESKQWQAAIEDEYLAQLINGTWNIVERPTEKQVIGNRLVFRTKDHNKKKVRLVAKGYSQRPGEDFTQTYSPVVRSSTIRLISAIAAQQSLEIHQMDFVTAYLNGELDEDIYTEIPDFLLKFLEKIETGCEMGTNPAKWREAKNLAKKWINALNKTKRPVCKLIKALYGLRQSGLQWYKKLTEKMFQLGLKASQQDPCLFFNQKGDKIMFVTIYVDDLLIATNDENWRKEIKQSLAKSFEMKDLGKVKKILGIEFFQSIENNFIFLSQKSYTESILVRFKMENSKAVKTPLDQNCKLDKPSKPDYNLMKKYPYQSLIGAMMYLAVSTRPDVAYAVNFLSQFNSNYGTKHWQAAKRVLRYLNGTADYGLLYRKTSSSIYGVVDADWGNNLADRKSYSGYGFILNGSVISWEARKQRTVALSSTEAEFLAITEAAKEAIYLKHIMSEIGVNVSNLKLFNDSQSAQKLIQSVGYHSRTKHIDVRHQFLHQTQQRGDIQLEYKPTDEMEADVFTKGLGAIKHTKHIHNLGLISRSILPAS